jgi:hypothetical protein
VAKKGNKKAAKQGDDLATNIKLGTRVRHVEDGVEGRIVWANAAAVKIQWQDGEKVTWKRAELGAKGLAVIDEPSDEGLGGEATVEPAATEPGSVEPAKAPEAQAGPVADATNAEPATTPEQPIQATPESASGTTDPVSATEVAPEHTPEIPAEPTAKKRRTRTPKPDAAAPKKPGALDAAAKVLAEEMRPMGTQELIGAMAAKGYWTSPGGKTPAATLYSAILRELQTKGDQARFVKVGKGMFALRPQA